MGTKTDDLGQKKFTDFRDGGKFSSHKALILLLKGKRQLQKNKSLGKDETHNRIEAINFKNQFNF